MTRLTPARQRALSAMPSRIRAWNADLERERARAMANSVLSIVPDTGADGPAALARTVRTEEIEGRSRGSAARGERITARRVICECHIDTLHAQHHIDARQWKTGIWFRQRYLLGYKSGSTTAGYGERIGGAATTDEAIRITGARADLAIVAGMVGLMQWAALEAVAGHDQPVGRGGLKHLVGALDIVALWRDAGRPTR